MRAFLRLYLGSFLFATALAVSTLAGVGSGVLLAVNGAVLAMGMLVLMLALVSRGVGWGAISTALFMAWKVLGLSFPLEFLPPVSAAALSLAAQVVLAAWLWAEFRWRKEGRAEFSARRFVALGGVLLLSAVGIAGGGMLTLAGREIEQRSAGFVRLGLGGLELEEREFERGGQRVRLIGMIHIGRSDFYRGVHESLNGPGRMIVLLEGVKDREGVLAGHFSYGRVAGLLGLTSQETSDLQRSAQPPGAGGDKASKVDYRHADVDVSSFSELTQECLQAMTTVLKNPGMASVMRLVQAKDSPFQNPHADEAIARDLIQNRNAHLLGEIRRALAENAVVVVPWGALHLPEIEAALRAEGFRETRREARIAILW